MMKRTHKRSPTPPSVTVRVKPNTQHSLRVRRGLLLKRPNGQESQGPAWKSHSSQRLLKMYHPQMTVPPTIVIQGQEMTAFFRLFDDDLIQDFLLMDSCYKMTDKYLLAMTFVYFKRARFTIAEYTRRNFFIALYLSNTMEEDEEENKYEIFPWALGKNWRKLFPHFIKQRDKLWARIDHRAAVSRHCCEEIMAIVPSHSVWQRTRLEHHGFAQRQYGDRSQDCFLRGPSASPVFCALCNCGTRLGQGPGSALSRRGSSAQTQNLAFPFISAKQVEISPPRAAACRRKTVKTKHQAQDSCCCCAEVSRDDESSCGSSNDSAMDWINEE
ncbi:speedy protein A [Notolabrus celidotus]|uniref:speedy protein A n=1 Tax=Notolabrus celidotus TaxID=1203425 RepID=UPI00148F4C50|nr:speedy protein A [Notolabrus celidotus]XP_034530988.1 speedy protein A [Notolabrus celidotus]